MAKRDPYLIKSVLHASRVISAFGDPGEVVDQRELVRRTGLGRGIVRRVLYTLDKARLVEQIGPNRYRSVLRRSREIQWKIGYGVPGIDSTFVDQVTQSLQTAAEQSREIELLILDHRYKPAITLRNAEQFIRAGVDLVIEYQVDEQLAAILGNHYRKAGIPVIAINNPHPGATYFGANNYEAGLIGGRYLGQWAKAKWGAQADEIVMVELGHAGAIPKARLTGMVKGICEVFGSAGNHIPVIYIDGNGQFERSWTVMRMHLRSNRAQRALIGTMNDNSALGVLRAYEEAGRLETCAVMGQNGSPEARWELRKPTTRLVGSVAYFPEAYGLGLVRTALDILNRRFVPPAVFIHHKLLTPANVDHIYPNDALMDTAISQLRR